MRISDWSSDVCSSDLAGTGSLRPPGRARPLPDPARPVRADGDAVRPRRPGAAVAGAGTRPALARPRGLARRPARAAAALRRPRAIGRAPCRERVCQYVLISGVAGSLKKKEDYTSRNTRTRAPTNGNHAE